MAIFLLTLGVILPFVACFAACGMDAVPAFGLIVSCSFLSVLLVTVGSLFAIDERR